MKKIFLFSLGKLYRIFDVVNQAFFPVMPPIIYENNLDKSSPLQAENLLNSSSKALRKNLTYYLDKRFRESLIETLSAWVDGSTDFLLAKNKIHQAIQQRPKWLGLLIPSDCFTQLLGAFGFFTFMDPKVTVFLGRRRIPVRGKITRISRTLGNSTRGKGKIWRDFRATFDYSETPFSPETIQLFRSLKSNKKNFFSQTTTGRSLIIGPSEIKEFPPPYEFEICLILVTPSSDLKTLRQQTILFNGSWVINSAFAALLCDPGSNSELKVLAQKAEVIYCNHNWTSRIQSIVQVPVLSYNSNFMDLWMAGAPNLLHRALGLTLSKGLSATVVGANLYIADNIYQQTINEGGYIVAQPTRTLHEFFTCNSYSNHDPAINFITAKRLRLSDWIIGDEKVNNVLSWTLGEYLLALEKSIGMRRL